MHDASIRSGRRRRRRLAVIVAVLAAAVLSVPAGRWVHRWRLNALFEGTFEETDEPDRADFYALPRYVANAVASADGGAETVKATTSGLLGRADTRKKWERLIELNQERSPTVYRARWQPRFLTVSYPPTGAVFPPNLCAPFVEWRDVHNDFWQVVLSVPGEETPRRFLTHKRRWRIPDDVWEAIRSNAGGPATSLRVLGVKRKGLWGRARETVHRSKAVAFTVAKEPADNAVVYRLIDPPAIMSKTAPLYVRDLREKTPRLFWNDRGQYCANCHVFSSPDGQHGKMALPVRYLARKRSPTHRVYLALYDLDRKHGTKVLLPFAKQQSAFMSWSPDGTKLVMSANQEIVGYQPLVHETQSITLSTSDIAVYDAEAQDARRLPGASSPQRIEVYPCWRSDGQAVAYSTATVQSQPWTTHYDLALVDYNNGNGGVPAYIRGASRNGKSNYYARFSPDGKWMSFTQSNCGSLIKASSDIWIVPANAKTETMSEIVRRELAAHAPCLAGTMHAGLMHPVAAMQLAAHAVDHDARPLASNCPWAADSWHCWSRNSRWLLFVSKRDDGVFARIYLTYIDRDGNASPAVRLPIDDPDIWKTFNVPEFVGDVPPIDEQQLYEGMNLDADVVRLQPRTRETHDPRP